MEPLYTLCTLQWLLLFPDMPLDNSPEYHDISITHWQVTCLILVLAIDIVLRVHMELAAISD